jgi:cytoplasmic FMR1 interacting protein
LEKSFKNKLEVVFGTVGTPDQLSIESNRIESLMAQRHVQLLGRSVNLNFILGQNINNKIYRDIDFALKRFESADIRGIIDLKALLDILSEAHFRMSKYLSLDPFINMLYEVNESSNLSNKLSTSGPRGRIAQHIARSLIGDIFSNFSYNSYTQRFISSPIAIRPNDGLYLKPPKHAAVSLTYGIVCSRAFEMCSKLTR